MVKSAAFVRNHYHWPIARWHPYPSTLFSRTREVLLSITTCPRSLTSGPAFKPVTLTLLGCCACLHCNGLLGMVDRIARKSGRVGWWVVIGHRGQADPIRPLDFNLNMCDGFSIISKILRILMITRGSSLLLHFWL